jgi:hypothetical protein
MSTELFHVVLTLLTSLILAMVQQLLSRMSRLERRQRLVVLCLVHIARRQTGPEIRDALDAILKENGH